MAAAAGAAAAGAAAAGAAAAPRAAPGPYAEEVRTIKIGDRVVGPGYPTYIIAEISCNHQLDYAKAEALVRAAAAAGADAVKGQLYTADTITLNSDKSYFQLNGGDDGTATQWDGMTLHKLYSEAYTPWEWMPKLKELSNSLGMDFFASPFDHTAVDFLQELGVPVMKVASFENGDIPLLKKIASCKVPIIMSTGMASLSVIEEALAALREEDPDAQICMLKCTSEYPAPPEKCNLRTIPNMAATFRCVSGLSDHTTGTAVPVAAVALGACLIEKHFKLDKESKTHDDAFSLTPEEFKDMVDAVRVTERALGTVSYGDGNLHSLRRSLFVCKDIKKGEAFTAENIRSVRPSHGIHTRYYTDVLGTHAACDIEFGEPLKWSHIADFDEDKRR